VQSASQAVPITPVNVYERQVDISRMLHHHYGPKASDPTHDLQQLLALCKLAINQLSNPKRALDIGCGAGRLTFELCREFTQVDGIDFTARYVQHCLQLKEQGLLRYTLPQEGELEGFYDVKLSDIGFSQVPTNINFMQGDGHNLKAQFNAYDLVVCHKVLEYLYAPQAFIQALLGRINPGGILILGSSYAWDAQLTPKNQWLGGFKENGENQKSEDYLKRLLAGQCELLSESQIICDYQLDSRLSQRSRNHMTVWRKLC
jgi:putative 4-mercaptohistidine N1-methyltranferase